MGKHAEQDTTDDDAKDHLSYDYFLNLVVCLQSKSQLKWSKAYVQMGVLVPIPSPRAFLILPRGLAYSNFLGIWEASGCHR